MPFRAYILENSVGRFHVGHTGDLDRRLAEHNDTERPKSKYTAKHCPWTLVWSEQHPTRSEAMAREKLINSRKSAVWIKTHLLNR